MGNSVDNKERTAARIAANTQLLGGIRQYTLTELEPILGVTHRTLQNYVKSGKLKAVRIGGKWKVSEDTLRKFINGEE